MATLTQVAITTRKVVRYSIYLIIFLIVGRIVLGIAVGIIQKLFPSPPPAPTVTFGKLPKLPFPTNKDLPTLTYNMQTPEGSLPTFSTQAKVYFMPIPRADLLSLDKARQEAANLGYTNNPTQISESIYQFSTPDNLSMMEVNIVTGTFSLGYNLNSDSSPLSSRPPTADNAGTTAKTFLNRANLLPDDLSGPVTQEYLKVQNKQLINAISLSEANLIKINLFRKDYDKLPAVTPNPNQANVWFVVSGDNSPTKQVVGAQFYYYPVDETQFSTYPIRTSSNAFDDLKAGKGYIANLGQNTNGKITIRRVYLAYFDAGVATEFYQPVVVFEGDNGFVAYVPAVTSTYYSE